MRQIIKIDESKCNGCGDCIPNCPEGALQIINGKARLVSEAFCDGLGECIGHCPKDAIFIEEREAENYDEKKVMKENIVPKGEATIKAHLKHLKEHNADEYLNEAIDYLKEKGIEVPLIDEKGMPIFSEPEKKPCECPGALPCELSLGEDRNDFAKETKYLKNWPVQLHLIPENAPFLKGSDLLLAADCTAFTVPDFHKRFLNGKILAIGCPKLDDSYETYEKKLAEIIKNSSLNSLTIAIMEVPCCNGLLSIAKSSIANSGQGIHLRVFVVGIDGSIKKDEWK